MKSLVVALLLLAPVAANAASPTDAYLAARDAYIAKFQALEDAGPLDDAFYTGHEAALADLGRQLEPIVGPVALAGYSAKGKVNLDTLVPSDEGFGLLDGLVFASADGEAEVLVTTDELFHRWLPAREYLPQAPADALKADLFFTQALITDSNVLSYAEIPVVAADASSAYAILAVTTQDLGPQLPDQLFIEVERGGRLFLVNAPAASQITRIPACDAVAADYDTKMKTAEDAYDASDPKDDKLFDVCTGLQEEGDDAYRKCFVAHAPAEAFFPALVKQAQSIVDALPAK
jgi:hypothetical protein